VEIPTLRFGVDAAMLPERSQGYRGLENMAERVGFEPTLEFPLNTLSKRAPSATRPSLRLESVEGNDSLQEAFNSAALALDATQAVSLDLILRVQPRNRNLKAKTWKTGVKTSLLEVELCGHTRRGGCRRS
jgi:hypothetical protein